MSRLFVGVRISAIVLMATMLLTCAQAGAAESTDMRANFAQPSRHYSSGPLWVWNDLLTDAQITGTLRDLAGQHVKQVWVHPRPGLMTPYLSKEWFRLWRVALDEAERLDMNVWIYDENSYPSGFAGGFVPDALPNSRGLGLNFSEKKLSGVLDKEGVVACFRLTDEGYENVLEEVQGGKKLSEGRYLVGTLSDAPTRGWFGGKWYVDLLKPGVTEKFIEVTHRKYLQEIGDQFGKRVPGIFTDEPHLRPAGGLHYTENALKEFQRRWGYKLSDHYPSLLRPIGDWRRIRHNYQQLLLEQFIEHWSKPNYEFCEQHGLEFTGHYWEHGWPSASHGPDNMAMYAWHQRPAIDNLMNEYHDDTHAQFGNSRTVKELASVANQLGRRRTLCETYGAGGWDLRFEDMKRIGDWLYVLGVNTLNEHLSYITIRGARKRDHPQSFSYHTPWWEAYHVEADYITRLSLVLSEGKQINEILLLEPTTTAWMYQPDPGHNKTLEQLGAIFVGVVNALEQAQAEYDIGCEDIMARHGSVVGKQLKVGQRTYHTLVLPPMTENLNTSTVELVEAFVKAGGRVLCCGPPPAWIDGSRSDRVEKLASQGNWKQVEASDLPALMQELSTDGFRIERAKNDAGLLFHHRRQFDDGYMLFLVNTSIEQPSSGTIGSAMHGIERWNLETGKVESCPFTTNKSGVKTTFNLPPCGSLLLWFSKKACKSAPLGPIKRSIFRSVAPPRVRRIGPNVLTLDYVDIKVGDESHRNLYFYKASKLAFVKNGMEDGNPWDSQVQFRDELITKTFPADSGFEVSYRFTVEGQVPKPLCIVVERADLYTITCNGKPITARKGDWWLDKSFAKIDISKVARSGENVVTLKASPFRITHEIEPAYVLGDFTLKSVESGFVITPPRPLTLGKREKDSTDPGGTMWLSGGIGWSKGTNDPKDGAPFVVFDLKEPTDLRRIDIWNYNEINATKRGVRKLRITASTVGKEGPFDIDLGTFTLDEAANISVHPARLAVAAKGVRFVRFDILSNQNGETYPTRKPKTDSAFVGLSEVQFLSATGQRRQRPIRNVAIAAVSSELSRGFNRLAKHLVDGSGLTRTGWNGQGHPFYAKGVAYTETFEVPKPNGRYHVTLSDWYGSVAKVLVNGKLAGFIGHRPWQCDVTEQIRPGSNTVEVVVIGTLRNTLGPHHAGSIFGKAWPHIFRIGPETGPPPGRRYSTASYGLFQPFVLWNSR